MNALKELLVAIEDKKIIAAEVWFEINYDTKDKYILYRDYSNQEYDDFLKFMEREYDNGWGCQELFGTVWFKDSWLERAEYDGSEWWTEKSYPKLPEWN